MDREVTPTDHGWIDDGSGTLSCIAGDQHSLGHVVVCPYYIALDLLPRLRDVVGSDMNHAEAELPTLRWRGQRHVKITALAAPERWHDVVAALDTRHGLTPAAWSLFSLLDSSHADVVIDPRDALRSFLTRARNFSYAQWMSQLLESLGDHANESGTRAAMMSENSERAV